MHSGGGQFKRPKIAAAVDHAKYDHCVILGSVENKIFLFVDEASRAGPELSTRSTHGRELAQLAQDLVDPVDDSIGRGHVIGCNAVPDLVQVAACD